MLLAKFLVQAQSDGRLRCDVGGVLLAVQICEVAACVGRRQQEVGKVCGSLVDDAPLVDTAYGARIGRFRV